MGEGSSSKQDLLRARDRANPMAARGRDRTSHDPSVSGMAFGIRGAANRGNANGNAPIPVADLLRGANSGKGKARVPGGSGPSHNPNHISQAPTGRTIAVLKRFLQSRWANDARFLNLEAMAADTILLEEGIKPPGSAGAHKDLGSVIWKLCKEMFPAVSRLASL